MHIWGVVMKRKREREGERERLSPLVKWGTKKIIVSEVMKWCPDSRHYFIFSFIKVTFATTLEIRLLCLKKQTNETFSGSGYCFITLETRLVALADLPLIYNHHPWMITRVTLGSGVSFSLLIACVQPRANQIWS